MNSIQNNAMYLQRPARKQKDFVDPKNYHKEGQNEYNIWYGRYIGDQDDNRFKEAATDRCKLELDAGFTKADVGSHLKKEKRYFCLHFARGMCAKGSDCTFYHRVPLPEDDAACDELVDCFGRQRHRDHRDDMGGVGSFMKPCRTLFVGNLLKHKYMTPKDLDDAIWKHFSEWGELENVNVVHRLSIAFPRYRLRTSAEFAKEAMMCQSLDQGEILSIKWAHDDPNPVAQDAIQRADKDALAALLTARGFNFQPAAFNYPSDYSIPDAKRARVSDSADVNNSILEQYPHLAYPDTDCQYHDSSTSSATAPSLDIMTPDQYAAYCNIYYGSYMQQSEQEVNKDNEKSSSQTASSNSSNDSTTRLDNNESLKVNVLSSNDADKDDNDEDDDDDVDNVDDDDDYDNDGDGSDWTRHVDAETGAVYYYNRKTGESSWGKEAT